MAANSARVVPVASRIANVYRQAVAITPADNTQIGPYEALYVGGAGNAVLYVYSTGTTVTFNGLTAGQVLQVEFSGVNATGTTATGLIGLG